MLTSFNWLMSSSSRQKGHFLAWFWLFLKVCQVAGTADGCTVPRTALCFYGQLREVDQERANHLIQQLVKPLCADVFVVAEDEAEFDTKISYLATALATQTKAKIVPFSQESRTPDDMNLLVEEAGGNLTEMFEKSGLWLGGLRNPQTKEIMGSSTAFLVMRWSECLHAISEDEGKHGSSNPYQFVVLARTDLHWVLPHPRIDQFNPSDAWTFNPKIVENGGIIDHYLLMNRSAAELVFAPLWKRYASGEILKAKFSLFDSENLLHDVIVEKGIRISHYPAIATLVCDHSTSKSNLSPCGTMDWHSQSGFFNSTEIEGLRLQVGPRGLKSRRPHTAQHAIRTLSHIQRTVKELKRLMEDDLDSMYSLEELARIANGTYDNM